MLGSHSRHDQNQITMTTMPTTTISYFRQTEVGFQKSFNSTPFPAVVSPNPNSISPAPSLSLLSNSIESEKAYLDSLLHKAGAILFRGFKVDSASDFNNVVESFGFEELPYVGGVAPRTNVVGRVFTANEAPPDQKIHFHHEMAYLPEFPAKLFLYCEVEPGSEGETPLVLSHVVYERIKKLHPDFVEKLEQHGLLYFRILGEEDDPSSYFGRGWKSTFSTKDKAVAEERATKSGIKLEWLENDAVKTIMGPLPAIKFDKSRNRKIWFNSIMPVYEWEDSQNGPLRKGVTFGDGKPLPRDIVHDCLKILEEESVAFSWQKGDVLLIDNWAVLHARNPFEPPRRVLASLCK